MALEDSDPVLRDWARGWDPYNNIRMLSRRYREAAMKCLAKQGVFWGKHNVQSLQALILLVHAMGHSQGHKWVLLDVFIYLLLLAGFRWLSRISFSQLWIFLTSLSTTLSSIATNNTDMTYNVAIALACQLIPKNWTWVLSSQKNGVVAGQVLWCSIRSKTLSWAVLIHHGGQISTFTSQLMSMTLISPPWELKKISRVQLRCYISFSNFDFMILQRGSAARYLPPLSLGTQPSKN